MEKVRKYSLRPLAAILVCAIIAATVIPVLAIQKKYGSVKNYLSEKNGGSVQYPCVLVHGFGGWGENAPQGDLPYFGVTTGSLAKYLRSEGYKVCVPTVGPYSSTWDRACELYAQLTGTRVDYGAAHAEKHGHARYGRTYTEAMAPDWGKKMGGQRCKVDLVSHSFGGPTIALLTSLMAYGDKAEKAATGKATSPLFTGGKASWVHSVTTICSPHNGSQLTCMVDDLGAVSGVDHLTGVLVELLYKFVKQTDCGLGIPDLMLDQFGIGKVENKEEIEASLEKIAGSGTDHSFYDLSPDGAAELNKRIRMVDSVYYFSYAFSTTKEGTLVQGRVPEASTPLYLYGLSLAIGSYTGTSAGGIEIDETWQDNDGLISVVSELYPFGKPHADMPQDLSKLRKGVWYVMPVRRGDHGGAVGGLADTKTTRAFFDEILQRDADLPR